MNTRTGLLASCLAATALIMGGTAWADVIKEETPLIQIGLLLDTSNSMDGLIDQAKAQLWKIVNEFVMAKRDGKRPEFQVALYEYGNNSLDANEGYVRQILPLTPDLDKVSEELFALTTNGGKEYCGTVIRRATDALGWSASHEDLKMIFIAGNEPFTQGDVDFRKACPAAIARGVTVNTIFCGPYDEGVSTQWKEGALLADGSYMNIDQDQELVHIDAPQDEEIARLGEALNDTYIAYGAHGSAGKARQTAQDAKAGSVAAAVNVQRQAIKASGGYKNVAWDLVDALKEEAVQLEALKEEDLPEEMKGMSAEEREAHVKAKGEEREKIQEQIQRLNEERKKYVATERKKLAETGEDTLDAAMIKAIRAQATKKQYTFE